MTLLTTPIFDFTKVASALMRLVVKITRLKGEHFYSFSTQPSEIEPAVSPHYILAVSNDFTGYSREHGSIHQENVSNKSHIEDAHKEDAKVIMENSLPV